MHNSSLVSLSQSQANLIGLGSHLSVEERNDLFDLLTHAEGFASRFLDHEELWKPWLDRYRNRLEKHGCISRGSLSHPPQVINDYADFDAQLGPVGTGGVPAQLARQARDALGVLRGSAFARRFFQRGSANGQSSTFLVTPCLRDARGRIEFAVYAFQLNASVEIRDFDFWTETRRDIVVWHVGTAYRFDREQFAAYREQVQKDLLGWSQRALEELSL